jgi:hypothetical protein
MNEAPLIKIEQKATIEWYDAEGKVTGSESCYRGNVPLFKYLATVRDRKPDEKLCVFLNKPEGQPGPTRLVIAEGTLAEVLEQLQKRMMSPPNAFMQLQLIISQLAEFADLKGIIVTAVFEDAQAVGFGFLSESTEVTDGDITTLVGAAEGQLDMFKDAMRKKRNMQFEGDRGRIIIPGR